MLNRVFIVDCDVISRGLLYEIISGIGFSVITLVSGQETLDRLKRERPVTIIIDDSPGEYSGIRLVEKIRAFDKKVKIILMGSEPGKPGAGSKFEELRISLYLKKDFQNSDTVSAIFSVLREDVQSLNVSGKKWGRILVVDDEKIIRRTVSSQLFQSGFDVECAESGEECIEKIKNQSFDIVLLDITMEGMDGLLTLKKIKEIRPDLKVVMATGIRDEKVLDEALKLGASDYLMKPFNFNGLEALLLALRLNDLKIKVK
ncbi:MAG TPA: hypothetical protein DCL35_00075 [Candidatus Omnitrophica bacterium]|nr:hypothetical protein [Candidatus Omnitrophota bacterium]